MKKTLKIAGISIGVLLIVIVIFAKANHISPLALHLHEPINLNSKGKAVGGFDVVSYFTAEKPIQGKEEFSTTWKDAIWLFSSEENKILFNENPDKYAPQYGGYCAFAVANGFTADCDGSVYKVENNQLFLSSSPETLEDFLGDSTKAEMANQNWN